jgi:hypothetical protein
MRRRFLGLFLGLAAVSGVQALGHGEAEDGLAARVGIGLGLGDPTRPLVTWRAELIQSRCEDIGIVVRSTGLAVPATAASGAGPVVAVYADGAHAWAPTAHAARWLPPTLGSDQGTVEAPYFAAEDFVLESAGVRCGPCGWGCFGEGWVRGWGVVRVCERAAREACLDPQSFLDR